MTIKQSQLKEIIKDIVRETINERKDKKSINPKKKLVKKGKKPVTENAEGGGYDENEEIKLIKVLHLVTTKLLNMHLNDGEEGGEMAVGTGPIGGEEDGVENPEIGPLDVEPLDVEPIGGEEMGGESPEGEEETGEEVPDEFPPQGNDETGEEAAEEDETEVEAGEEEEEKLKEGGPQYKVVKNTTARCSKCNHALEVQQDPQVNEFKKQGHSYKTFDDSPQFPDAINLPTNA